MTAAEWLALTICAALIAASTYITHRTQRDRRKDGRS